MALDVQLWVAGLALVESAEEAVQSTADGSQDRREKVNFEMVR